MGKLLSNYYTTTLILIFCCLENNMVNVETVDLSCILKGIIFLEVSLIKENYHQVIQNGSLKRICFRSEL